MGRGFWIQFRKFYRELLQKKQQTAKKSIIIILVAVLMLYCTIHHMRNLGRPERGSIHKAVSRGENAKVFFWLAVNPKLATERDSRLNTPLHTAAEKNRKFCCIWLIFWGCPVNALNRSRQTPLHKAAYKGHNETCRTLIRKGADVNARDLAGQRPLDIAITWGRGKTADLLRKYSSKDR